MVYLEKSKITKDELRYFYCLYKGDKKGVLIYFPKTDICRVEEFCEKDSEDSCYGTHRDHAFVRMMEYVKENKYPDFDMVAWG